MAAGSSSSVEVSPGSSDIKIGESRIEITTPDGSKTTYVTPSQSQHYESKGLKTHSHKAIASLDNLDGVSSFLDGNNSDMLDKDLLARQKIFNAKRGDDIKFQINIELEEAASGLEKEITFERYEVCNICLGSGHEGIKQCSDCHGKGKKLSEKSLKIKIPPGVDTGTKIRYPSVGHCGENGGLRGDIFCLISINPHPIFIRNKSELSIYYPITKRLAVQGGLIRVPSLIRGKYHELRIPSNTKQNGVFRLENVGIPLIDKNGYGDIIVIVNIYDPREISQETRGRLNRINKYL